MLLCMRFEKVATGAYSFIGSRRWLLVLIGGSQLSQVLIAL